MQNQGLPQLTFDGDEIPAEVAMRRSSVGRMPTLTESQRLILAHIEEHGFIRSVEAGVIVHAARGHCGPARGYKGGGVACCHYAGADGLSAMQRLGKRGLIEKAGVGQWTRVA